MDELAPYYLRKVRILNGIHSAMTAKYLPAGFKWVKEVLADKAANRWVRAVLFEEIVPVLAHRVADCAEFTDATYDRLRNPFIEHKLTDISLNHAAKVAIRLETTRDEYRALFHKDPPRLSEILSWRP